RAGRAPRGPQALGRRRAAGGGRPARRGGPGAIRRAGAWLGVRAGPVEAHVLARESRPLPAKAEGIRLVGRGRAVGRDRDLRAPAGKIVGDVPLESRDGGPVQPVELDVAEVAPRSTGAGSFHVRTATVKR